MNTRGRIVTFYSYKGGTGRSMAVANVAWILASNGLRVLVLDWDLEAPGLHRYFRPFLADPQLVSSEGIIDFVVNFAVAAVSPPDGVESNPERPWFHKYANLLAYATSLEWPFPGDGTIDFVPAGRQDPGYAVRVNSFHWQHFYDKLGGGVFFEEVKRRIREQYDYVLIDSRTGVTDTSGICTVQFPDELVVCFTLNQQSIDGAAAVASSAVAQRQRPVGGTELLILPVPTRVDFSEKIRLDLAREAAHLAFAFTQGDMSQEARDDYWGQSEVPYVPFYAYEEILAAFGDKPGQTHSMLSAMERLTKFVTDAAVWKLPRMPEKQRVETLARFLRQPNVPLIPPLTADLLFYLSHSASDDDTYLTRFFEDLGAEVRSMTGNSKADTVAFADWSEITESEDALTRAESARERSRVAVCVLSPSYLRSRLCMHEWASFRTGGKPIIPVLWVHPIPELPLELQAVQLSGPHFPGTYVQQGLRRLASMNRHADDYKAALMEIAAEVVEAASSNARTSVASLPRHFIDLVKDISNDSETHEFQYQYELVQQDASIDRFGNYKGVYTHDAINDTHRPIENYTVVLRTDTRARFSDLKASAYIKIGSSDPQECMTSSEELDPSRSHKVRIHFPNAVNPQVTFSVALHFEWPKAILDGTDGDALDLSRFKLVKNAVFRLTFEQNIGRPLWWWRNPSHPNGTRAPLERYPYQPEIKNGQTFEIRLPHPTEEETALTVYAFSCDLRVLPNGADTLE